MHEQLASVYSIINQREQKSHIKIKQTPEIFINEKSTPDEIKRWFELKEFGDGIYQKFEGLNVKQLFELTRTDLQKVCGTEEGKRLFSQLQLQKSCSVSIKLCYIFVYSLCLLFCFRNQTLVLN